MNIALLVLHVILSLGIITLVLLQKGAGASAGAAFGGGGAGSVFGASGSSNFLSKTTAILATAFFANSLLLAYLAAHRDAAPQTVIDRLTQPQPGAEVVVPDIEIPAGELPADMDVVVPPAEELAPEQAPAAEQAPSASGSGEGAGEPAVMPPVDEP